MVNTDLTPDAYRDALLLRVDGTRSLSAELVREVAALCDRADDHEGRGAVVVDVSGAPRGPWTDGLTVALVNKWERALRRLERLPIPTIAVASGDCGGAAFDVLLASDYRLAGTGTRLLLSVDSEATWPGMATYRLSQQLGAAPTRRTVLFGQPITAAEALSLHLVDELVDDAAEVWARVAQLAGSVTGSELAIRRQLMLNATMTSFEDALGVHLAACDRTLRRATARVDT
ncbi:enoyl-CoA-hydratase DpgB [Nonomuraea guangzhouensis]|uniref:Enoyl-CoA-hydratase DpgB n=1 Tax=Nonomuraea guangzhouensis TaxID=1291555 RepID=A0ABW4FYB4_9ACTN|nr:enoyl-CoA-hydratase DpgB [Nonomuraea guangzhouensis]